MTGPQTVSQMFPSRWLKASDLTKPTKVFIETADHVEVFDKTERKYISKRALSFRFENGKRGTKRFIPNKTQCFVIWKITGTETFDEWIGHSLILAPGQSSNGKDTILVSKPNGNGINPVDPGAPMPQATAERAALAEDGPDPALKR